MTIGVLVRLPRVLSTSAGVQVAPSSLVQMPASLRLALEDAADRDPRPSRYSTPFTCAVGIDAASRRPRHRDRSCLDARLRCGRRLGRRLGRRGRRWLSGRQAEADALALALGDALGSGSSDPKRPLRNTSHAMTPIARIAMNPPTSASEGCRLVTVGSGGGPSGGGSPGGGPSGGGDPAAGISIVGSESGDPGPVIGVPRSSLKGIGSGSIVVPVSIRARASRAVTHRCLRDGRWVPNCPRIYHYRYIC